MDTPNPTHTTPPPQTMFAVLRPDGQISLRTLHTKPAVTISKAEEDHTQDWTDLQAAGYHLATISLIVQTTHENAYTAIHNYERGLAL